MPKKYYAIAKGRKKGILTKWFGAGGAEELIRGYTGAVYKGFATVEEARRWLAEREAAPKTAPARRKKSPALRKSAPNAKAIPEDAVIIYTDGGALNNPGPGGYGVVWIFGDKRKEASGGYRLTTNNRMELLACIVALKGLRQKLPVVLHSDSKYVVDGITKGWAIKWRANKWMRTKNEKAKNADLWATLLALTEKFDVQFRWVKGHAGIPENERCDFLVNQEQRKKGLPADEGYENEVGK